MAINVMGISGMLVGWFFKIIIWVAFGGVFVFMGVGMLWLKKKRKFNVPILEFTNLGGGKAGIKLLKGGWFKSKTAFFGLIEKGGEDVFRTGDGRRIQNASSEDFHTVFGRMGLLVQRKGDDPKVLLPISETELINKMKLLTSTKDGKKEIDGYLIKNVRLANDSVEIINSIAPGDYRDTSTNIIQDSENETMSKLESLLKQYGHIISAGILLIAIIFIIQFVNNVMGSAWENNLEAIRIASSNRATIVQGASPLVMFIPNKIRRLFR